MRTGRLARYLKHDILRTRNKRPNHIKRNHLRTEQRRGEKTSSYDTLSFCGHSRPASKQKRELLDNMSSGWRGRRTAVTPTGVQTFAVANGFKGIRPWRLSVKTQPAKTTIPTWTDGFAAVLGQHCAVRWANCAEGDEWVNMAWMKVGLGEKSQRHDRCGKHEHK